MLPPFLGSGFVHTGSMTVGLRWFADHQPLAPVIETLRGLLMGHPTGTSAIFAIAWCAAITLASYLWTRAAFNRDPAPWFHAEANDAG